MRSRNIRLRVFDPEKSLWGVSMILVLTFLIPCPSCQLGADAIEHTSDAHPKSMRFTRHLKFISSYGGLDNPDCFGVRQSGPGAISQFGSYVYTVDFHLTTRLAIITTHRLYSSHATNVLEKHVSACIDLFPCPRIRRCCIPWIFLTPCFLFSSSDRKIVSRHC